MVSSVFQENESRKNRPYIREIRKVGHSGKTGVNTDASQLPFLVHLIHVVVHFPCVDVTEVVAARPTR